MCDSFGNNPPNSEQRDRTRATGYELNDEEVGQAQGGAGIIPHGELMHVELDADLLPECTPLDVFGDLGDLKP